MTRRKSSIYRGLENLLLWIMLVCDRVPNNKAFIHQINRLNDEMLDSLEACALALQQPNLEQRLELIHLVNFHFDNALTIIRTWYQWSLRNKTRIISMKQMAYYLTETEKIDRQISGWVKSTTIAINNSQTPIQEGNEERK